MQRLKGFADVGAVAAAVSAIAARPAEAAQGGDNGRAKVCQHAGWTALGSNAGASFSNQADCVNDGAQGLAAQPGPLDPQTACLSIPGRPSFSLAADGWCTCRYLTPTGPAQPTSLEEPCGGAGGNLEVSSDDGLVVATCEHETDQANG
jgi:hypothetical protein